jgi:CheY-like chemotaxis protein
MAKVLIGEPHPEVRELLVRVVEGMGLEPITDDAAGGDEVDLLVIEPGSEAAIRLAQRLRAERPELPVVCVSIYPPSLETELLSPAAYLVKPFSVAELQDVLRKVVASGTAAVGAASAPPSHQTQ